MRPMTRKVLTALVLVMMSAMMSTDFVLAQATPTPVKPATPTPPMPTKPRQARLRVIGVEEVTVARGTPITSVPELKAVKYPAGAPEAGFYLVAVLSRQILAETDVAPTDLKAQLTYPGYSKVMRPVAVVVKAAELTETDRYKVAQKNRYITERYHFPVQKGQRDWTFECAGCKPTKLIELYATLYMENRLRGRKVRVIFPDGKEMTLATGSARKVVFPAAVGHLKFVLDDGTRAGTPWKRVRSGQVLFAEISSGNDIPVLPYERLLKGLSIIKMGYDKYKFEQGKGYVGGGSYNIIPPTKDKDPVRCILKFGGEKGYIQSCGDPVTRVVAQFDQTGKVTEYSSRYYSFKVVPFGKLKNVSINKTANRIVGLTMLGRYRIEGTNSRPSLWTKGVLKRGVLVDPKRGRFRVQAKEFGKGFYILYGIRTK